MNEQSTFRPRNLLVPIFRLNDDILLCIFSLNSPVPFINFSHETFETGPLHTTIATSQVCFRWRLLCLSNSKLWSNINQAGMSSRARWREEILRRASSSPLVLKLNDKSNTILRALVQRLRSFTGSVSQERWLILTNEIQRPGSKLQSLSLCGNYINFDLRIHQVHPHALPLKHLFIDRVSIRTLNFSLLSNLSSLALDEAFTSAKALINGLMHMPGLTGLTLSNVIHKRIRDDPLDMSMRVSLPNLQTLQIMSDDELDYMSCLNIPAACIFHIHNTHPFPQTVVPLLALPQFAIASNRPVSFIVSDNSVHLSNDPAGFHPTFPVHNCIPNQDFDAQHSGVSITGGMNQLEAWLPYLHVSPDLLFAPGAPFSSATTLQLTIFEPYNASFLFKFFDNINILFVALDTLAIILSTISLEGDNGFLFPSLKKLGLTIRKVWLQLDPVISFLGWRREHDAPIDALELRYLSRDESWTSFVTVAQRHKLESLGVDLTLFFVVDEKTLVTTEILELPVDSDKDQVHKLKSLWDCR